MYTLVYTQRFQKEIEKLDVRSQQRILHSLEFLADAPRSHPHVQRIVGIHEPAFRLRVGRWRVIYLLVTSDLCIKVLDLFLKRSDADYSRRLRDLL